MSPPYRIPAAKSQCEIVIKKSRFITTVQLAPTVDSARGLIADRRADMPDANHHVYAFRVGYGNSVTEGMSDDGEPARAAGPPTLAVLRGSDIGDIVLVTARYFGGVKLGIGGLIRAYTEAAQLALKQLKTELKVERRLVSIELPYSLYNVVKLLIDAHNGVIEAEIFEAEVRITARFVDLDLEQFTVDLREKSAGTLKPTPLD